MLWHLSMYLSSMVFLMMGSSSMSLMSLISLYKGEGYFIEREIVSTNSNSAVTILLLDWNKVFRVS